MQILTGNGRQSLGLALLQTCFPMTIISQKSNFKVYGNEFMRYPRCEFQQSGAFIAPFPIEHSDFIKFTALLAAISRSVSAPCQQLYDVKEKPLELCAILLFIGYSIATTRWRGIFKGRESGRKVVKISAPYPLWKTRRSIPLPAKYIYRWTIPLYGRYGKNCHLRFFDSLIIKGLVAVCHPFCIFL
jgi:hypothetical protein